MITVCAHGMPGPRSCVECMADGPVYPPAPPRPESPDVVAVLTATYRGWCATCRERIAEGDEIARMSDGTYRHHPECTGD